MNHHATSQVLREKKSAKSKFLNICFKKLTEVSKNAELHADFDSIEKEAKKCSQKKISTKK